MKILFANAVGGYFGGVEQLMADLTPGLRARGHVCHLVCGVPGRDSGDFGERFDALHWCCDWALNEPGPQARPFPEIVSDLQPEVVFFHNITRLPDPLPKTRCVRMVHDVGLVCPSGLGYFRHGRHSCAYPAGWRCWLDLAFLARGQSKWMPVRWASIGDKIREMRRNQQVDTVLTVSEYMKERLVSNGFPAERIVVEPPVLPSQTQAITPVPDAPELLFVGTLQRGKGLDLLFDALRQVRRPFRLTIAGWGKLQGRLERMCRDYGLEDRVRFLGWVAHDALPALYAAARLVVVPTRAPESFCLVGPEAMRHGRPVVAFDVGGISSWLEHEKTGLLIPEQDTAAFAGAVERLLEDDYLTRQLAENAARRVHERFSYEDFVVRVESVLAGRAPGNKESLQ